VVLHRGAKLWILQNRLFLHVVLAENHGAHMPAIRRNHRKARGCAFVSPDMAEFTDTDGFTILLGYEYQASSPETAENPPASTLNECA
jgi:hypothetical protein